MKAHIDNEPGATVMKSSASARYAAEPQCKRLFVEPDTDNEELSAI